MLRRVVTLEAAVSLLLSTVVSAGARLLTAALFFHAQLDETLQPPTLAYYLIVTRGVVASLAIIASTFPLLARITAPTPPATNDNMTNPRRRWRSKIRRAKGSLATSLKAMTKPVLVPRTS